MVVYVLYGTSLQQDYSSSTTCMLANKPSQRISCKDVRTHATEKKNSTQPRTGARWLAAWLSLSLVTGQGKGDDPAPPVYIHTRSVRWRHLRSIMLSLCVVVFHRTRTGRQSNCMMASLTDRNKSTRWSTLLSRVPQCSQAPQATPSYDRAPPHQLITP